MVNFAAHDTSLVAVVSDVVRNGRPVVGLGFNSIGRFAQPGILADRVIPRLLNANGALSGGDGFDCAEVMRVAMRDEKPGGHGDRASAVAAAELAFWDLNAKLADEPAYATIARHFGRTPSASAPVYAAGGYYYEDDGVERLQDELRGYEQQGFSAYKMKIGGASLDADMRRVEAALEVCGEGGKLAVDANGRFGFEEAVAYADALKPLSLRWYEEVCDPLDFALQRRISDHYGGALATGENLFSSQDVRNLLTFAGMQPNRDIFQMDAGLSYGLTEYGRIIDMMEAAGFDRRFAFPHGGHLINLHIVCGLNLGGCEAYPSVFQPFGGYSADCRISDGTVSPGDRPGFGLEGKDELKPHIEQILS